MHLITSLTYSWYNHLRNPFKDCPTVVDCVDISNNPFNILCAIHELEAGWKGIKSRKVKNEEKCNAPRIVSLGGDHTTSISQIDLNLLIITCHILSESPGLPAIRALFKTWVGSPSYISTHTSIAGILSN